MVNRVQKATREDILHITLSKTRKLAVRIRVGRRVIQIALWSVVPSLLPQKPVSLTG